MTTTRHPTVQALPGSIRLALDVKGISRRELARRSGLSAATVANLAAQDGYPIKKDKAARIADALDMPVGVLFVHQDGAALA